MVALKLTHKRNTDFVSNKLHMKRKGIVFAMLAISKAKRVSKQINAAPTPEPVEVVPEPTPIVVPPPTPIVETLPAPEPVVS